MSHKNKRQWGLSWLGDDKMTCILLVLVALNTLTTVMMFIAVTVVALRTGK